MQSGIFNVGVVTPGRRMDSKCTDPADSTNCNRLTREIATVTPYQLQLDGKHFAEQMYRLPQLLMCDYTNCNYTNQLQLDADQLQSDPSSCN
jgi:hypothetical protein